MSWSEIKPRGSITQKYYKDIKLTLFTDENTMLEHRKIFEDRYWKTRQSDNTCLEYLDQETLDMYDFISFITYNTEQNAKNKLYGHLEKEGLTLRECVLVSYTDLGW